MGVKVYGSSDDLIEVEGDLSEEWTATDMAADYLAFSCGVVLRIEYTNDGVWSIRVASNPHPRAKVTITPAEGEDTDNYSDVAVIEDPVVWVVKGTEWKSRGTWPVDGGERSVTDDHD